MKSTQLDDLRSTSRDKVQDLEHTIINLTTEKEAAKNQAAAYAVIPGFVLSMVSNLSVMVSNDPTNRQQISAALLTLQTLTNALSELTIRPTFNLYINDIEITNHDVVIPLKVPRRITFALQNTSNVTAEQARIELITPLALEVTNLSHNGWSVAPVFSQGFMTNQSGRVWGWFATRSIAPTHSMHLERYFADPLEISTNVVVQGMETQVQVFSNGSHLQEYSVTFMF